MGVRSEVETLDAGLGGTECSNSSIHRHERPVDHFVGVFGFGSRMRAQQQFSGGGVHAITSDDW